MASEQKRGTAFMGALKALLGMAALGIAGAAAAQTSAPPPPAGFLDAERAQAEAQDARIAERWRFLRGPGVEGALRLVARRDLDATALETAEIDAAREAGDADEDAAELLGYFVLNIRDRGFYQGVYNLREDGRSIVGMFWAEEDYPNGQVAGFMDVGHAPDHPLGPSEGRLTFTDGLEITGVRVE